MSCLRNLGSVLLKAPQDLPPSKLYKKSGILGQQFFCTVLRGGGLKTVQNSQLGRTLADEALSILTLVTWVQRSACKLGLWPTPHVGWPLAKPNAIVCSRQGRSRLQSALRANQKSFFLLSSDSIFDNSAWLYSSELSYKALYSFKISYSYSMDHHLHQPRSCLIGSFVSFWRPPPQKEAHFFVQFWRGDGWGRVLLGLN